MLFLHQEINISLILQLLLLSLFSFFLFSCFLRGKIIRFECILSKYFDIFQLISISAHKTREKRKNTDVVGVVVLQVDERGECVCVC